MKCFTLVEHSIPFSCVCRFFLVLRSCCCCCCCSLRLFTHADAAAAAVTVDLIHTPIRTIVTDSADGWTRIFFLSSCDLPFILLRLLPLSLSFGITFSFSLQDAFLHFVIHTIIYSSQYFSFSLLVCTRANTRRTSMLRNNNFLRICNNNNK